MLKKRGITLIDVLISITIVGVIALLALPVMKNNSFKKINEAAFKKTYFQTENIIQNLLANEDLYPEDVEDGKAFLDNTSKVKYNGVEYKGNTKFCELFASQLNILNKLPQCKYGLKFQSGVPANDVTFSLNDNSQWIIPVTDFGQNPNHIFVDTNGPKKPNCFEGEKKCEKRLADRISFKIDKTGALEKVKCRDNEYMSNGVCIPESIKIPEKECPPGTFLMGGACVKPAPHPVCDEGYELVNNKCVQIPKPPVCPEGTKLVNGSCRVICPPGTQYNGGICKPIKPTCKPGEKLVNGICVPQLPCPPGQVKLNGKCVEPEPAPNPNGGSGANANDEHALDRENGKDQNENGSFNNNHIDGNGFNQSGNGQFDQMEAPDGRL